MFFDLNEPAGAIMEELVVQPMEHPVNPPIAPANDVNYSMDDLMLTPPPDLQATAAITN